MLEFLNFWLPNDKIKEFLDSISLKQNKYSFIVWNPSIYLFISFSDGCKTTKFKNEWREKRLEWRMRIWHNSRWCCTTCTLKHVHSRWTVLQRNSQLNRLLLFGVYSSFHQLFSNKSKGKQTPHRHSIVFVSIRLKSYLEPFL